MNQATHQPAQTLLQAWIQCKSHNKQPETLLMNFDLKNVNLKVHLRGFPGLLSHMEFA